jgi:hypothetical protein
MHRIVFVVFSSNSLGKYLSDNCAGDFHLHFFLLPPSSSVRVECINPFRFILSRAEMTSIASSVAPVRFSHTYTHTRLSTRLDIQKPGDMESNNQQQQQRLFRLIMSSISSSFLVFLSASYLCISFSSSI